MIPTPYVEVNLETLQKNIDAKTRELAERGIAHRPHVKTHKSTEIARMQRAAGAAGITVSKLGEAKVFFDAGFDDILVAYNLVGRDKLDRYAAMHRARRMLTTVDSKEVAEGLDGVGAATGRPVDVLVELNLGEDRCGVPPGMVAEFARMLREYRGLRVVGAMSYHGSIYSCASEEGRARIVEEERDALLAAQGALRAAGFAADITSAGSSIASRRADLLAGVSEIRCGNYVFNDRNAIAGGAAGVGDCSLRVAATVISLPAPGRATLDAGSKTLSGDRTQVEGFGLIVGKPNAVIESLNEEHAMVKANGEPFYFGERVSIVPNHACSVVNLANAIYGFRDGEFAKEFVIEARGLYN